MYKFMIEFLEIPYGFFKQFSTKQYAFASWYIIALILSLAFLAAMCEAAIR